MGEGMSDYKSPEKSPLKSPGKSPIKSPRKSPLNSPEKGGGHVSQAGGGRLAFVLPLHVWRFTFPALIAFYSFFFIVSIAINNCPNHHPGRCAISWLGPLSSQELSQNPLLGASRRSLVRMGALDPTKDSIRNQQWRIFTCLFLHAGFFHLVVNMLTLVFFGARLEREYGTARIGILYFVSGLGGSLWSALLLVPNNISVGASFPTFGVIGCTVADMILNGDLYVNKVGAAVTTFLVTAVNIVIGLMPFVDNWGQIGGFLTGFFVALLVLVKPRCGFEELESGDIEKPKVDLGIKSRLAPYQDVIRVVAIVFLGLGFLIAFIAIGSGADYMKKCDWCASLNCVDTKLWTCPKRGTYNMRRSSSGKLVCRIINNSDQGTIICDDTRQVFIGDLRYRTRSDLQVLCRKACG